MKKNLFFVLLIFSFVVIYSEEKIILSQISGSKLSELSAEILKSAYIKMGFEVELNEIKNNSFLTQINSNFYNKKQQNIILYENFKNLQKEKIDNDYFTNKSLKLENIDFIFSSNIEDFKILQMSYTDIEFSLHSNRAYFYYYLNKKYQNLIPDLKKTIQEMQIDGEIDELKENILNQ